MIRDLLSWWTTHLLALAPAWLVRRDAAAPGALLVEPEGVTARLLRRRGGTVAPLGRFRMDEPDQAASLVSAIAAEHAGSGAGPVLLRLPPGAALHRALVLPLAAEAGLDRVLSYEMDRLTPFSAEEVFHSWSVTHRDREAGQLHLRLSLVQRAALSPLLSLLGEAGLPAQAIEIGEDGSREAGAPPLHIPLAHRPSAARLRGRRLFAFAGAGCAALAVLAVVLPFAMQSLALSDTQARIDRLSPAVEAARALQNRLSGGAAGAALVSSERRRLGDTLGMLSALTRVLPDDSYLTDLTLRRGELTFSGQSPQAARLIAALSADPAFRAPAFSAPVTRIEGQGADLFSIRTGIHP